MERIRSRTAFALGGGGRVRGGGLIALLAAGLLAGVGCTGAHGWRVKHMLPAGWVPSQPATQITPAFNPQIQHLPDPTQEGNLRAGIAGQVFLLAADGSFTDVNGDLVVMAEDITPRAPGQPPAVPEVWQFDPVALRKLKTKDERWGDCYALFLPYPPNWKDVTQLRISTKYEPKGDRTKEPVLYGPPQTLMLDFTPPGSQPAVWLDKSGPQQTAPSEIKAIPNVSKALAKGLGKPLDGPTPGGGTVQTGGVQYPNGPQQPGPLPPVGSQHLPTGANPVNPFAPQGGVAPPPPTTPPLPPSIEFSPDRPQTTTRGPNGETLNVTAVALPPGQSVPAGWERRPDGSIMPAGVQNPAPQGGNQWTGGQTNTLPPSQFRPASERFQSASERYPASQGQTQTLPPPGASRIQHGAFNQQQQPQPLPPVQPQQASQSGWITGQPLTPPSIGGPSAPLPALPSSAVPGNRPADPTLPSLPPVNFDPNLPVGAWANQPQPVIAPPPPSGGAGMPIVLPPQQPGSNDGPLVPVVLPRR